MTLKTNPSRLEEPTDRATIGTKHMGLHPVHFEIQRKNNFEFVVPNIDGITLPGKEATPFSNARDILRYSVTEAAVPHFSQNVIKVNRGNNTINYAGVPEFSAGSFVFNDFIGEKAKEVLMAWQSKSYNTTTQRIGLVKDYKKDCYLCEYSPDYQLVRKWKMYGCWISELSEGAYSSDDNEKQQITATIQYDWAEIYVKDSD